MKISLRKANALQLAITEVMNSINTNTEFEISQFEEPIELISARHTDFVKNLNRRDALTDVLYSIRKDIGNANNASGIDDLLCEIAKVEKKMQFAVSISKQRPKVDDKVILGKLEKLRNQTEGGNYYGHEESVRTSFLSQEDLDKFKSNAASFKKLKQTLQDQLLELNVRTDIELDELAVNILQQEELL